MPVSVTVRPLLKEELPAASQIVRVAFASFLGIPDPSAFMAGRDFIRGRWLTDPTGALGAEIDGKLIGSNFVTCWGSFGIFGPLTVLPEHWDQGVAKALLKETLRKFELAGVRSAGLFTFAQSPKHTGLYQKFGFWPRSLTAVMSKPVNRPMGEPTTFSQVGPDDCAGTLDACRAIGSSLFLGLDVTGEIQSILEHRLGDTVLVWEGTSLQAMALCYFGADTEGGPDTCYVKFGAVRGGAGKETFLRLLAACESLAGRHHLPMLEAGTNLARRQAFEAMREYGFVPEFQGVPMHMSDEPAFSRADDFVVDDWR